MKNNLLLKYVKPYLFSLFFTAAMTSLLWITVTYGSLNAVPIAAGLCALLYTGLALAALVNLFKGNKLFEGSSADVLSVGAQKRIRVAGVAIALPALIYCGIFAYLVKSYDFTPASDARLGAFQNFELSVFGSSRIWDSINSEYSLYPISRTPDAPAALPAPEKDVDFAPFMAEMQRKIKKVWLPGKTEMSQHTEVFFAVDKLGNVSKLRLETSCGSDVADKAALDAVEMAAPFVLPPGAPESVDIKFSFDYNTVIAQPTTASSEIPGDTF